MTLALYNKSRKRQAFLVIAALLAVIVAIAGGASLQPGGTAKAATTTAKSPTANDAGAWAAPGNAFDGVNDTYATATDNAQNEVYKTFNFPAIAAGSIIDGIEAKVEVKSNDSNCDFTVGVSWDGGSNYTSKTVNNIGTTDVVRTFGSNSDAWSRTWSASDFTNTNFRLRITSEDIGTGCSSSATYSVDNITVEVFYSDPPVYPTMTKQTDGTTATTLKWKLTVANTATGNTARDIEIDDDVAIAVSGDVTASLTSLPANGSCSDLIFGTGGLACHVNAGGTLTITYSTPKPAVPDGTCSLDVTNTAKMWINGVNHNTTPIGQAQSTHTLAGNCPSALVQGPNLSGTCTPLDIHLVVDNSGSIGSTDLGTLKTQLFNASPAGFIQTISTGIPGTNWNITKYNAPNQNVATSSSGWVSAANIGNGTLGGFVTGMTSDGYTPTGSGIAQAVNQGQPATGNNANNLMIILTDGAPNISATNGSYDYFAAGVYAAAQADAARTAGWTTMLVSIGDGDSSAPGGANGPWVQAVNQALAGIPGTPPNGQVISNVNWSNLASTLINAVATGCTRSVIIGKVYDPTGGAAQDSTLFAGSITNPTTAWSGVGFGLFSAPVTGLTPTSTHTVTETAPNNGWNPTGYALGSFTQAGAPQCPAYDAAGWQANGTDIVPALPANTSGQAVVCIKNTKTPTTRNLYVQKTTDTATHPEAHGFTVVVDGKTFNDPWLAANGALSIIVGPQSVTTGAMNLNSQNETAMPPNWSFYGLALVTPHPQTGALADCPTSAGSYSSTLNIPGGTDQIKLCVMNRYTPITVKAYKIVCESEADLPNLGNDPLGDPVVPTASGSNPSIAKFLADNPKCHFADGWKFQWGYQPAQAEDGLFLGASSNANWNNFDGDTATSGGASQVPATATVPVNPNSNKIWVREELKAGYVAFNSPGNHGTAGVSAEMRCYTDQATYDNYDYVTNPQAGQTYYCVALNASLAPITVNAYKVVCIDTAQMPTSRIDTKEAADTWIAGHNTCAYASDWEFTQAPNNSAQTLFGPTDPNGLATTTVPYTAGVDIMIRERLQIGYIPFAGSGPSARLWCQLDFGNHVEGNDNQELITNPPAGSTQTCVAFNAPTDKPTIIKRARVSGASDGVKAYWEIVVSNPGAPNNLDYRVKITDPGVDLVSIVDSGGDATCFPTPPASPFPADGVACDLPPGTTVTVTVSKAFGGLCELTNQATLEYFLGLDDLRDSGTINGNGYGTTVTTDPITIRDESLCKGSLKIVKNDTTGAGGGQSTTSWSFNVPGAGSASFPGNGFATFFNLTPGPFTVAETEAKLKSNAECQVGTGHYTQYQVGAGSIVDFTGTNPSVNVVAGQQALVTFYNKPCSALNASANLVVQKFNDPASNRTGTTKLGGWVLSIQGLSGAATGYNASQTTPASGLNQGQVVFAGIPAGTYRVCEVPQANWSVNGSKLNGGGAQNGFCRSDVTITNVQTSDTVVAFYNQEQGGPPPGPQCVEGRDPACTAPTPPPQPTPPTKEPETPVVPPTPPPPPPTDTAAGARTPGPAVTPIAPSAGSGSGGSTGGTGSILLGLLGVLALSAGSMLLSLNRKRR